MAVCNPPISNLVREGATTLDDSTSVTNSTDTGSDSSMALSLDRNVNDSTCHDVCGNIRRSPRSLDKLITEVKKPVDERSCLEDEILAVTLMKSVAESTDRQKKNTVSTLDLKLGTNVTGVDANNHAETDSRVGVTLSCQKLPDVENDVTDYMELEGNRSCVEPPHVVDDNVMSPTNAEKDDPNFSGVYCGTRKRKRDARHPDSPCSMEGTLTLQSPPKVSSPRGFAVRSRAWNDKGNPILTTKSVAPLTLGSSSSLLAARCSLLKTTIVTNSSVPNPLLGPPFKVETDNGASEVDTLSIMRRIPVSDLKETTSLGGGRGDRVKKEAYSNVNSLTAHSVKQESNVVSDMVIGSLSSQYSSQSASIAPKCASLPESCPVKREEEIDTNSTNKNSTLCFVLPNYESDTESTPIAPRQRIFSIDLDREFIIQQILSV